MSAASELRRDPTSGRWVIIDSPLHRIDLSALSTAALAEVLRMIGDRVLAIEAEGRSARLASLSEAEI